VCFGALVALAPGCSSSATNPPGKGMQNSDGNGGGAGAAGDPFAGAPGVAGSQGPQGGATGMGGRPGGGSPGAGGIPPLGQGGSMPGMGGMIGVSGAMGTGGVIVTKGEPTIPPVNGDCPDFKNSTINFMGISGLQIVAGAKPTAPTAPMVLYWHGTVSNAGEFALMAGAVQQGVVSQGGILVSPNGTTGGDLLSGTSIFGAGDLKVMDQLVACAVKNNNVDPKKIYTMGCSAGGLMSVATAAMRSGYIAAAAPNSGGTTVPPMFQNAHTPALMTVHGKMGSDVVVIDFASSSASADMLFKSKGGFVIDCDTGAGHCGGGGLAGDAWKFFQAHPFGVDPEPWASMLPAGFSAQCKIK
jgi:predicted esterase